MKIPTQLIITLLFIVGMELYANKSETTPPISGKYIDCFHNSSCEHSHLGTALYFAHAAYRAQATIVNGQTHFNCEQKFANAFFEKIGIVIHDQQFDERIQLLNEKQANNILTPDEEVEIKELQKRYDLYNAFLKSFPHHLDEFYALHKENPDEADCLARFLRNKFQEKK